MGLCTLLPQLNLDQSIPTLSCLDHSIPPLNCLDHSIPFRSRYTVGTVWVLDQSYSVQNCLDLGIRNFLDQNPHPFLDLSHRDHSVVLRYILIDLKFLIKGTAKDILSV